MTFTISEIWMMLTTGQNGLEIFSGLTTIITSCYAGWQFWKQWRKTEGIRAIKEALEKTPNLRYEDRDDREQEVMLSMLDRAAELGPMVRERLLNRFLLSLTSILILVVAMFSVHYPQSLPGHQVDVLDFVFAVLQALAAGSNRSRTVLLGEVEQVFLRNTAALQAWFYATYVIPALKDFNQWAAGQNRLLPFVAAEKNADLLRANWVTEALAVAGRKTQEQEREQKKKEEQDKKHLWKRECLQCGTSILPVFGARADLPTEEWLLVPERGDSLTHSRAFGYSVSEAGYEQVELKVNALPPQPAYKMVLALPPSPDANSSQITQWEFPGRIYPTLFVFALPRLMYEELWSAHEVHTVGNMPLAVPNVPHLLSLRMKVAVLVSGRDEFEMTYCKALLAANPEAISKADWKALVLSHGLSRDWIDLSLEAPASPKRSRRPHPVS